jgi:hypothetical protein
MNYKTERSFECRSEMTTTSAPRAKEREIATTATDADTKTACAAPNAAGPATATSATDQEKTGNVSVVRKRVIVGSAVSAVMLDGNRDRVSVAVLEMPNGDRLASLRTTHDSLALSIRLGLVNLRRLAVQRAVSILEKYAAPKSENEP